MKTKFGMVLVFAALSLCGGLRADIVALNTTTVGTQGGSSSLITTNTSFLRINFTTNNNPTQKFTGIKFNNLGTGSFAFKAILNWGSSGSNPVSGGTDNLTYSSADTIINFNNIANKTLNTSTSYFLEFTLNQADSVTFSNFSIANSSQLTNSTNWIGTPISQSSGSMTNGGSGPAFSLYATVPEPGTLILTGSALVAGAVGAYIKRRRNKRAQADAHS
jgi:hypothetical protein